MSDYDHTLLASAPSISRKQKQESYNIDILQPSQTSDISAPSESAPLAPYHSSSPHATPPSKEGYPYAAPVRLPWYQNKILIASGIGLVVVGAIVGGAVGGTVGHRTKSTNALTNSGSSGSDNDTTSFSLLTSSSTPAPTIPSPESSTTLSSQPSPKGGLPTNSSTFANASPSGAGDESQGLGISGPGSSESRTGDPSSIRASNTASIPIISNPGQPFVAADINPLQIDT
ncbi:hypothetical protein BDY19DRAFT_243368 [Irpex rosettiformis]|uniref:Uncharacterized protein n=1 Tax=Irpex rosettiformis TaxID=378272 RepID=A0ACB8TZ77_9APHY|nr:hypothetical protein BDY19DRAFT_243368 [Irpex rosettiformis]